MEQITLFLGKVNDFAWGWPLLVLLLGTGLLLTVRLGLIQIVKLPKALKLIFTAKNHGDGDINSFGALCTALAATVGTGNIVGVATAIAAGGPGALFWMWIAAFIGMATKYAEGVLAIKYRTVDANGQMSGGPMYYILNGMGKKFKPLAVFFAFSGVLVALLGIGTFSQVNSITSSINSLTGLSPKIISIIVAALVGLIVIGGIKNISKVSSKIVPIMAILYLIACGVILAVNFEAIPSAFMTIISSAFTGHAAMGGFTGAVMKDAISKGVARGVFSNESGLGSAPIAAAAAKTHWPAEQGLISMTGTFIDSILICTLTGLTLVITGIWTTDTSAALMTQGAFSTVFGSFGSATLSICLVLFAFTTILGWNYYGERCIEFLFGVKGIKPYRLVFVLMVALGGFLQIQLVWTIADIVNALMAFPNLIALLALSGVVVKETKAYFNHLKQEEITTTTALEKEVA
ncbi:sodium:alanine symporter family protein [Zhenhengia yiwuensis]|uniref:alanine/glycine:cation symporter family protein n=1 Tax=Zhenhengia yiwuensis TaxID=2763666 RepID=UPI001B7C6B3F|nr:sodium:alanine symporter family protein [Zhenhengia yiwuensis]MBP3912370.1 alanine:cation symporter family protein [Niameybacter sp.]MDY3367560.1 sodium:alanine symporter family protein [Zhenhengia yiwuensis]